MRIITHPNPILKQKTVNIDTASFGLEKLQKLAKKMIKTTYKNDGIGLAAPQIGKSLRLCVVRKASALYPCKDIKIDNDLVLFNPYIVERSIETNTQEEGCLSLPKVNIPVARSKWIKIHALNAEGKLLEFEAKNFFARVIQHEVDHLDGILIIDKQ